MYDKLKAILGKIESELSKIHPDPIFNPYNIVVRIKEILQSKHPNIYQGWKEKGFDKNHPFLFKKGVKDDRSDNEYTTLLHIAVCNGYIKVVKALVARGANVNAKDNKGRTPLHWAAFNGHKDVVQALLNVQGIDVHAEDKNKHTPLHWATNKRIVKALIVQGANVHAEDKNKQTPLHWAVKDGNTAVIEALINNNAEVNAKDNKGRTPLHFAASGNGRTLLHWAARGKIVRYLIIQGASINARDNDKNTPLHLAAKKDDIIVIKALLDNNANIHAKNKAGRTPLYFATNVDIKNALIAADAKDVPVGEKADADIHSEDEGTPSRSADVESDIETDSKKEEEEINAKDEGTTSHSANAEADTDIYSEDGNTLSQSADDEEEEKEFDSEGKDVHTVEEKSSQGRIFQNLAEKNGKEQPLETAEKIYYLIPIIIGISVCFVTAALGMRVAALFTTTEDLPIKQFSMTPAIIVIIAIALITSVIAYEAFKPSTQVNAILTSEQSNSTAPPV